MRFETPLVPGRLIRRYQRFLADVRLDSNEVVTVHCPNSGSMLGCSEPGRPVLLAPARSPTRRTRYTWELIKMPSSWVGINTLRANELALEALRAGRLPPLASFDRIEREVKMGARSRIDFVLRRGEETLFLEVKNVTLVVGGKALFPDARTERGRKHLQELSAASRRGSRAAMLYVVQRQDAEIFSPAENIDPQYAASLHQAHEEGVEVLAFRARVSPTMIAFDTLLPVDLG